MPEPKPTRRGILKGALALLVAPKRALAAFAKKPPSGLTFAMVKEMAESVKDVPIWPSGGYLMPEEVAREVFRVVEANAPGGWPFFERWRKPNLLTKPVIRRQTYVFSEEPVREAVDYKWPSDSKESFGDFFRRVIAEQAEPTHTPVDDNRVGDLIQCNARTSPTGRSSSSSPATPSNGTTGSAMSSTTR